MIRFILIIALFFGVLALSPLLIDEKGYILIAMDDTIIEFTVLSAIIMFFLFFIAAFTLFKLVRGGFKISFKAWSTVAFASRRRGVANFNKGLVAYMLEDYKSAEKLFAKSAEPAKRQQSAYLLAAVTSAKQQLNANTNHYLTLLEQETSKLKEPDLTSVIIQVKLLMDQEQQAAYKKARSLIDENHKQIGHDVRLLSLEINLCLIEKRFERAVDYLMTARKEKTIDDGTIQAWEAKAYYGAFVTILSQKGQSSLQDYWQTLSKTEKKQETILFAYCRLLAEQNIITPLIAIIAPILNKKPSATFLKQLRTLPIKQGEPLMSLVTLIQKHLLSHSHNDPQHAQWLSCLGHLAVMNKQWSMAEKAFRSLLKLGQHYDKQDLQALASALTEQKQYETANEVWLKLQQTS